MLKSISEESWTPSKRETNPDKTLNKIGGMDPHFSSASPLNRQDSLLFSETLILEKFGVATYLIYFKGKIKQEVKP